MYKNLEVNKNTGHFDREEYGYVSFYGKDYVTGCREYFEMFVKYSDNLHCMRATEMNLKVIYHEESDKTRNNWFLGNEAELAKLLLTKRDEIIELA
ncbi:hypothetical protein NQ317_019798 [Molorchus minor]|uniref:Hexosyltransferase n=1 Tax=Molorchus minor TaxID=1323400 RepID=A0ABQ9JD44_9CUCU|nr:hypothetical protein NQ317_019798 [Molorchus minor]